MCKSNERSNTRKSLRKYNVGIDNLSEVCVGKNYTPPCYARLKVEALNRIGVATDAPTFDEGFKSAF